MLFCILHPVVYFLLLAVALPLLVLYIRHYYAVPLMILCNIVFVRAYKVSKTFSGTQALKEVS